MKVLALLPQARCEEYTAPGAVPADWTICYMGPEADDQALLAAAGDADFIVADAVRPVSGALIRGMANLKLVHSEGVGYNQIDVAAAKERGIPVCNNPGINAVSVAEQAVLLMLGVLRQVCAAHQAVADGQQIQFKSATVQTGLPELGEKTVGFVGFGAIARQTALRLRPFGCTMYYWDRYPLTPEGEAQYQAKGVSLPELLSTCDIVSLHLPVTPETQDLIRGETIAQMRDGAVLINTARGELVCQEDLAQALRSGKLGGAGLDVLSPEPVTQDNPLVQLQREGCRGLLFSPHIAGLSRRSFSDAYAHIWKNLTTVAQGGQPDGQVR